MTAPVFLTDLSAGEAGHTVTITGAEATHIRVMRLEPGDRIDLVDGEGTRALARVTLMEREQVTAEIISLRHEETGPRIVLVQALTKAGGDEDAIARATECGVDMVIPWAADRSIAKWPAAKAERAAEKWRAALRAAMKQSRRSRLPALLPLHTSAALAAEMARASANGATVLVLHESALAPLHEIEILSDVWIVVGPEGGITQSELDEFMGAGATLVRAGQPVMRASTAGAIGVSHAARALGRWNVSSVD